jgi:hypothetical protein
MKLGKNQLERLLGLASPTSLLVVGGDRVIRSLAKRGMVKAKDPCKPNAWLQITPAGLRVLADALEAGELEQFFTWPKGLQETADKHGAGAEHPQAGAR